MFRKLWNRFVARKPRAKVTPVTFIIYPKANLRFEVFGEMPDAIDLAQRGIGRAFMLTSVSTNADSNSFELQFEPVAAGLTLLEWNDQ